MPIPKEIPASCKVKYAVKSSEKNRIPKTASKAKVIRQPMVFVISDVEVRLNNRPSLPQARRTKNPKKIK